MDGADGCCPGACYPHPEPGFSVCCTEDYGPCPGEGDFEGTYVCCPEGQDCCTLPDGRPTCCPPLNECCPGLESGCCPAAWNCCICQEGSQNPSECIDPNSEIDNNLKNRLCGLTEETPVGCYGSYYDADCPHEGVGRCSAYEPIFEECKCDCEPGLEKCNNGTGCCFEPSELCCTNRTTGEGTCCYNGSADPENPLPGYGCCCPDEDGPNKDKPCRCLVPGYKCCDGVPVPEDEEGCPCAEDQDCLDSNDGQKCCGGTCCDTDCCNNAGDDCCETLCCFDPVGTSTCCPNSSDTCCLGQCCLESEECCIDQDGSPICCGVNEEGLALECCENNNPDSGLVYYECVLSENCCGGIVINNVWGCCNGEPYNKNTQTCCCNQVVCENASETCCPDGQGGAVCCKQPAGCARNPDDPSGLPCGCVIDIPFDPNPPVCLCPGEPGGPPEIPSPKSPGGVIPL